MTVLQYTFLLQKNLQKMRQILTFYFIASKICKKWGYSMIFTLGILNYENLTGGNKACSIILFRRNGLFAIFYYCSNQIWKSFGWILIKTHHFAVLTMTHLSIVDRWSLTKMKPLRTKKSMLMTYQKAWNPTTLKRVSWYFFAAWSFRN